MFIPFVCNASSDWILFSSNIRDDTECWIQCITGNTRRLLAYRLIFCSFWKFLRKCLLSREMLLFPTYKFARQHFNEHRPGSDVNLLFPKLSAIISRIPQNAPTSMRSRSIFPRLSSYNKFWNSAGVTHHRGWTCVLFGFDSLNIFIFSLLTKRVMVVIHKNIFRLNPQAL